MKKRILSIVLVLCMVLSFVPITVFAAEGITPTTPQKDTEGVYQIGTVAELYGFAQLVNGGTTNASAVLTKNITVHRNLLSLLVFDENNNVTNGDKFVRWTPIGNFSNKYTGTFDGQGHTISGLYCNNPSTNGVGLFGCLGSGGEIKNLGVIDSYFNGKNYVGGVCGYSLITKITSCYNTGTVSGEDLVGGVCGYSSGTITGCYNTGTVSGYKEVGGVCGDCYGPITDCYNIGTVSGTFQYIGGVCGYGGNNNNAPITGCYNTGTVSGKIDVGGVCGINSYDTIIGCYNTGKVSGSSEVGGVCGWNYGTITGCYNTGTVSGSDNKVSGVCGDSSGTITGCYTNNGGVYGENNGTVTDCDEKSNEEFANGTVCKKLNSAIEQTDYDVRFCQRIGTDA